MKRKPKRSRAPLSQRRKTKDKSPVDPVAEQAIRRFKSEYPWVPRIVPSLLGLDYKQSCKLMVAATAHLLPEFEIVEGYMVFHDDPEEPMVLSHCWFQRENCVLDWCSDKDNREYGVAPGVRRSYHLRDDWESQTTWASDEVAEQMQLLFSTSMDEYAKSSDVAHARDLIRKIKQGVHVVTQYGEFSADMWNEMKATSGQIVTTPSI